MVTKNFGTLEERLTDHEVNLHDHSPDVQGWRHIRNIAMILPSPLPKGWDLLGNAPAMP